MASTRLDPKLRRRCRSGAHRADCSGPSDARHALTERRRCTSRGHVRGCQGADDRRHGGRPSPSEAAQARWERERAERRSKAAKLREARRRGVTGLSGAGESFAQNGKNGGHGEYEYRAVTELSGSAESERDAGRRDGEVRDWLRGGVDELKACPLLWFTNRAWVCLLCRDILDSASQARVHAIGHIDSDRLPTNPARPKRTIRHLDPVRTSGYIVAGVHRKRRQSIPSALEKLAQAKLVEYAGWSWYPPAPTMPQHRPEAYMPSTPVPRWDNAEPIALRPDPTETPERRRLINEAKARSAAGERYDVPREYRHLFPDYVLRQIQRRNVGAQ